MVSEISQQDGGDSVSTGMLDGLMTMFLSPYQTSAARPEEILYNRENIFSVRLPADWQEHQQVSDRKYSRALLPSCLAP